ncbi:MAG: 50S ribosomal protein L35 [Candidatus Omnitrophica bacterium]|nr:50S ribosomal protein L35 [Candidatus Omnitrophota bacterium]MBU2044232.1 50S ribosomal protein L35 [Candidatus Omnitrophota bacterium]MBU2265412.1 50S ribosomal protein L35 [Candidatus Omnitrophota bacterium]MBU2473451.1 50S ribosomal protein L35 [Candidatus Omnitrophota bacterium]
MPKLKTKKSLAKRVKITKKKKALYSKPGRRHLLSSKSRKRKRSLKRKGVVPAGFRKMIRQGLPYSG